MKLACKFILAASSGAKGFGTVQRSKRAYAASCDAFELLLFDRKFFPVRLTNLLDARNLNVSRSLPPEIGIELPGREQASDVVNPLVTRPFEIIQLQIRILAGLVKFLRA
jgi:hypothetical protein